MSGLEAKDNPAEEAVDNLGNYLLAGNYLYKSDLKFGKGCRATGLHNPVVSHSY